MTQCGRAAAVVGLSAALALGSGGTALAQVPAADPASGVPAAQDGGPGDSGFRLAPSGRPTLQLPFGEIQFRGRVAGTVQSPARDRGTALPDPGWQTARLQVEGTLFTRLEFEVSREFGDAEEPERDLFANFRVSRGFELRGGQFKVPFGRDALTGGANLDFVYRSLLGRQLAPGRDLGVMAHGRVSGRRVTYQAGLFPPRRRQRPHRADTRRRPGARGPCGRHPAGRPHHAAGRPAGRRRRRHEPARRRARPAWPHGVWRGCVLRSRVRQRAPPAPRPRGGVGASGRCRCRENT